MPTYEIVMTLSAKDPSGNEPQVGSTPELEFRKRFPLLLEQSWRDLCIRAESRSALMNELHHVIARDCYFSIVYDLYPTTRPAPNISNDLEVFINWVPTGRTHEGVGVVKHASNTWIYHNESGVDYTIHAQTTFREYF